MTTEKKDEVIEMTGCIVACPRERFSFVEVTEVCAKCSSFAGIEDRFPNSQVPTANRYLVRCSAEPVKRSLFQLAKKVEA